MSEPIHMPPPPPPPPPPAVPAGSPQFDFVKPFTYVFDDPDWLRKILIGGLFALASLFIVGIFFVLGYMARTVRNVANDVERPLPEWEDLGGFFNEGLRVAGVWICYALPVILLMAIFGVPAAILSAIGNGEGAAAVFGSGLLGCMYCLLFPLELALALWVPGAVLRVIMLERFNAAFEFRAIWTFIRSNMGPYLLAFVVNIVAGFLAGVGFILLCVGVLFTIFWSVLVNAHGLGQVWRTATVK